MRDDFCILILTHARPNNVKTLNSLKTYGYSGPTYLVVDDQDKTLQQYRDNFGDRVKVFSKSDIDCTFDVGDNFKGYRGVVYARHAAFDIARSLGFRYFAQFDDDYHAFYLRFGADLKYGYWKIRNLDAVFCAMLEFFESVPGCLSICMSQGGDHAGGTTGNSTKVIYLMRKAMNTFICSTDRPFKTPGRMNEDVNLYCELGSRGGLFFSLLPVQVIQDSTQAAPGGMTDAYQDTGTYVKSFYSVMRCPSFVMISEIGKNEYRIHHRINWEHAVPKIVRQELKRA